MRIRISVAGLASKIIIGGKEKTIVTINPGAWNKDQKKLLTPFGGALNLTSDGFEYIKHHLGATHIHSSDHNNIMTARFEVADAETAEKALRFFEGQYPFKMDGSPRMFEDPIEGIILSLQGSKLKGFSPTISKEEALEVKVTYVKSIRQEPPTDGRGTSVLSQNKIPTRRLFYKHILEVTNDTILNKILDSLAVRVLNPEIVATTKGGTCQGITASGEAIGDNVFD